MKDIKRISIGILLLLVFVLSLNTITIFGSISETSGYSHYSEAKWEKMPGKAKDIAVGRKYIWHISKNVNGDNLHIWNYYKNCWNPLRGRLTRITANDRYLWGFNDNSEISKLIAYNSWVSISTEGLPSGKLIDIAVGGIRPRESLFVIGPSQRGQGGHAYKYTRINGRWQWEKYDDELVTRITVNGYGYPWAINEYTGKIYYGNRIGWNQKPGKAWHDIAAGTNDVYMLGYYNHWRYGSMVYKYVNNNHWERVSPLGLATNIDTDEVQKNGKIWVINGEGTIYRYLE